MLPCRAVQEEIMPVNYLDSLMDGGQRGSLGVGSGLMAPKHWDPLSLAKWV